VSAPSDIAARLKDAWRAIVEAEQARGQMLAAGGDDGAAQATARLGGL
jgi:hypothetical protein